MCACVFAGWFVTMYWSDVWRTHPKQPLSSRHLYTQRQKPGGTLAKPYLKIHNLGCVCFVNFAPVKSAFSPLVDHKFIYRASIYVATLHDYCFQFMPSTQVNHMFVCSPSEWKTREECIRFHPELLGGLLQQTPWIKSHLHRSRSSVCQASWLVGTLGDESICSCNPSGFKF